MGNNVGFEIQYKHIKIVYLAKKIQDIEIFNKIESKFMKERFVLKNECVLFLFKFTFEEFIKLRSNQKVKLIQEHFKQYFIIQIPIEIYMNKQTSLLLNSNLEIKQTLNLLLPYGFEDKNRHTYESSVISLSTLNFLGKQQQFFHFVDQKQVNELHLINSQIQYNKKYEVLPQYPFILASLRKGALFFKINSVNGIQKLAGSIIGQQTISEILLFNSKENDLDSLVNRSFQIGNNLNVDLIVEDIYGKSFQGIQLNGNIIASSLGKIGHKTNYKVEDQVKSLIISFGINIAQFLLLQMKINNLKHSVLIANKFHNKYFYYIIQSVLKAFQPDFNILFAEHGNYISCIGNIQL